MGEPERTRIIWEPRPTALDQGDEGACVGFAWSAELAATPHRYGVSNETAFQLYHRAQEVDRAMGNNWPEGASVLAGAKVCAADNWVAEYRWAFGIADVIAAIQKQGPVVLGINWHSGMYKTNGDLLEVNGSVVGGHAIMANGYDPEHEHYGEVVMLTNSWGPEWGNLGSAYITTAALADLLAANGEACVPLDVPLPAA